MTDQNTIRVAHDADGSSTYTIAGVTYVSNPLLGYSDHSGTLVERANVQTLCDPHATWSFAWHSTLADLNRGYADEHTRELWAEALPLIRLEGDYGTVQLLVLQSWDEWADIDAALADYPVLDDGALYKLESEAQDAAWVDWARSDFIDAIASKVDEEREPALHEFITYEACDSFLRSAFVAAMDETGQYWATETGGGQWVDVKRLADVGERLCRAKFQAMADCPATR